MEKTAEALWAEVGLQANGQMCAMLLGGEETQRDLGAPHRSVGLVLGGRAPRVEL